MQITLRHERSTAHSITFTKIEVIYFAQSRFQMYTTSPIKQGNIIMKELAVTEFNKYI